MIAKRFRQIITLLLDILLFTRMKLFDETTKNEKVIFVDFENPNLYHRYFYNLLQTFKIAGYRIIYPMNFSKFRNLRNGDYYLSLMFKENGFLEIKNTKQKPVNAIVIKDEMFSADYYKNYFQDGNIEKNAFHVPMTFHPNFYASKLWNQPLKKTTQINSLFSFGNFDRNAYKKILDAPFDVIDRAEIIESFSKLKDFVSVKNKKELENLILNKESHKFVFVEKENFAIPIENVRKYLSQFRFFLCCPGVFAPLSHNFIEALSAGTVPIIQQSYADLIYPHLEHKKNAFIYSDWNHLLEIIHEDVFSISDEDYVEINQNAKKYYEDYLHPNNAAKNILKHLNTHTVFLNASERSVKLIHKHP